MPEQDPWGVGSRGVAASHMADHRSEPAKTRHSLKSLGFSPLLRELPRFGVGARTLVRIAA